MWHGIVGSLASRGLEVQPHLTLGRCYNITTRERMQVYDRAAWVKEDRGKKASENRQRKGEVEQANKIEVAPSVE